MGVFVFVVFLSETTSEHETNAEDVRNKNRQKRNPQILTNIDNTLTTNDTC